MGYPGWQHGLGLDKGSGEASLYKRSLGPFAVHLRDVLRDFVLNFSIHTQNILLSTLKRSIWAL